MKRIFSVILILSLVLGLLTACGGTPESPKTEPTEGVSKPAMNIMQKSDPAQDDTLNILMIGSSFCYYYVEELWGMLDAAGIKARVCNVYYSGCPLENHWNWWKSGEAHYEFFITDENGRKGFKDVNLEYCLKQGNWDIISLQESTHKIRAGGGAAHFANTQTYLTDLWGYIKEQFPQSRHFWHQPWAYQVGADKNGIQMTDLAMQLMHTIPLKDYAIKVCKEFDLEWVNSGEAWHLVRQAGYDELCARLGVNGNKGDYSHDGDIGGGQYLNACVWYEIITGQDCRENTYRPEYQTLTLSDDLIKLLQESAHKAVQARVAAMGA
jgi:hypothetical protein